MALSAWRWWGGRPAVPRLPRARACSVDWDCDVPELLVLLWCAGGRPAERGEVGPAKPAAPDVDADAEVEAKPLEDEAGSCVSDPAIPRLFEGEPDETIPVLAVPAADVWRWCRAGRDGDPPPPPPITPAEDADWVRP